MTSHHLHISITLSKGFVFERLKQGAHCHMSFVMKNSVHDDDDVGWSSVKIARWNMWWLGVQFVSAFAFLPPRWFEPLRFGETLDALIPKNQHPIVGYSLVVILWYVHQWLPLVIPIITGGYSPMVTIAWTHQQATYQLAHPAPFINSSPSVGPHSALIPSALLSLVGAGDQQLSGVRHMLKVCPSVNYSDYIEM